MSHWSRFVPMAFVVLLLWVGPAHAHDDDAVLELVVNTDQDQGALDYEVTLHYSGDGHPVTDATVTVAGDGPNGRSLPPVTLAAAEPPGTYRGRVEFPVPGVWTVRFNSVQPSAQLEHTEHIGNLEGADRSSAVAWTVGIVATFVVAAGTLAVWSAQRRTSR